MADFLPDASAPTQQGAVPVDTLARRFGYLATRPAAWMGGEDPYAAQTQAPMTRAPQAAMAGPMSSGISVGGGWGEQAPQPSLRARALQAQQQYSGGGGDYGASSGQSQLRKSALLSALSNMGGYPQ